jgi:hypothetical protein
MVAGLVENRQTESDGAQAGAGGFKRIQPVFCLNASIRIAAGIAAIPRRRRRQAHAACADAPHTARALDLVARKELTP